MPKSWGRTPRRRGPWTLCSGVSGLYRTLWEPSGTEGEKHLFNRLGFSNCIWLNMIIPPLCIKCIIILIVHVLTIFLFFQQLFHSLWYCMRISLQSLETDSPSQSITALILLSKLSYCGAAALSSNAKLLSKQILIVWKSVVLAVKRGVNQTSRTNYKWTWALWKVLSWQSRLDARTKWFLQKPKHLSVVEGSCHFFVVELKFISVALT